FEGSLRALGGLRTQADGSEQFDLAGLWKGSAQNISSWLPSGTGFSDGFGSFLHQLRDAMPDFGDSVSAVLPRSSAAQLPSTSTSGEGLIWAVAVVAFAIAGWKLFSTSRKAENRANIKALGPWPVAPSAIANRDDLVRAFEYLAVLRLGTV